eukprot:10300925-Heterocapsa_arctica.AAC.1
MDRLPPPPRLEGGLLRRLSSGGCGYRCCWIPVLSFLPWLRFSPACVLSSSLYECTAAWYDGEASRECSLT